MDHLITGSLGMLCALKNEIFVYPLYKHMMFPPSFHSPCFVAFL
jgi:hypothetical protein